MATLKTYRQHINELFKVNQPVEFKLEKDYGDLSLFAKFKANDQQFEVSIHNIPSYSDILEKPFDTVSVEFAAIVNGSHAMGKTGIAGSASIVVFAHVINIITQFVNKYDPSNITFTAAQNEKSRVKLYDMMVKRLASSKYKVNIQDVPSWGSKKYTLVKK